MDIPAALWLGFTRPGPDPAPGPGPYSPNDFEAGLEAYLSGALAVPIWAGVIPQNVKLASYPAIVYNLVAGSSEVETDGPTDQCELLIQFDCYGKTRASAAGLAELLKSRLLGYSGPMGPEQCLNAARENTSHGFDPLPSGSGQMIHRKMVEYRIWFRESIPAP